MACVCVCVCEGDGRQTPMCGIRYQRYLCFVNRIQVFACKWCCQEYDSSWQHVRLSGWRSLWLHFWPALKRDHASFASLLVAKKFIIIWSLALSHHISNLIHFGRCSYYEQKSHSSSSHPWPQFVFLWHSLPHHIIYYNFFVVAVGFPLFIGIDRFSNPTESPSLIKKNCSLIYFSFFGTVSVSSSCSSAKFTDRKKERGKRDDK